MTSELLGHFLWRGEKRKEGSTVCMQICGLMLVASELVRGSVGAAYLFLGKCCLRNKQTKE